MVHHQHERQWRRGLSQSLRSHSGETRDADPGGVDPDSFVEKKPDPILEKKKPDTDTPSKTPVVLK